MNASVADWLYWLAALALVYVPLFILAGIAKEMRPMWIVDVHGVDGAGIAQHHFATKIEALQFLANSGPTIGHASAPYHRANPEVLAKIIAAEDAIAEIEANKVRGFSTPKPY
jgi:triacylglycerol esterase/lipase EstA (alpha/beta hydrolase family)